MLCLKEFCMECFHIFKYIAGFLYCKICKDCSPLQRGRGHPLLPPWPEKIMIMMMINIIIIKIIIIDIIIIKIIIIDTSSLYIYHQLGRGKEK